VNKAWENSRRTIGFLLFGFAILLLVFNIRHESLNIIGPLLLAVAALWLIRGPKKLLAAQRGLNSRFRNYLEEHPADKRLWRIASWLQWAEVIAFAAWIYFLWLPKPSDWIFVAAILLATPSLSLEAIVIVNRYKHDRRVLRSA
jgi:hypothetical protein